MLITILIVCCFYTSVDNVTVPNIYIKQGVSYIQMCANPQQLILENVKGFQDQVNYVICFHMLTLYQHCKQECKLHTGICGSASSSLYRMLGVENFIK